MEVTRVMTKGGIKCSAGLGFGSCYCGLVGDKDQRCEYAVLGGASVRHVDELEGGETLASTYALYLSRFLLPSRPARNIFGLGCLLLFMCRLSIIIIYELLSAYRRSRHPYLLSSSSLSILVLPVTPALLPDSLSGGGKP